MIAADTLMHQEASEAASVVARQFKSNEALRDDLAARLRALKPDLIFTCARGSSDHAATYAKYLFETRLGIPTLSHAPSIVSLYGRTLLNMKGQLFLLISQSGKSPDLLMSAEMAKDTGALVVALVNDMSSPLATMADVAVPLDAGPERSVAATKSYIASLFAIVTLVARWQEDGALEADCGALPVALEQAFANDWSPAVPALRDAQSLFVLGRGLTLGIAQEAALKFKETCGIHAEAFSLAEVAHGPMALVKQGFPLLVFPPGDAAAKGLDAALDGFAERGARIIEAGGSDADRMCLPVPALNPALAPIAMIQSFYRLVNALAVARGFDPDHPPSLNKVTQTR